MQKSAIPPVQAWIELSDLLWAAVDVALDAGTEFDATERRAGVPLSSLLSGFNPSTESRPAEIHARRSAAVEAALMNHRRRCEASDALTWLTRRSGYEKAMQRLAGVRLDCEHDAPSMWWFHVNRIIARGAFTLLLLRRAERRGRLHMTAIQMRSAAASARRLRMLLRNRVDLPDEAWELLNSSEAGRPGGVSRLEAAALALERMADQPGRRPKNDATAVERKVAAELAQGLLPTVRSPDALVPVVTDIFDALGLTLDAKPIAIAVRRAVD